MVFPVDNQHLYPVGAVQGSFLVANLIKLPEVGYMSVIFAACIADVTTGEPRIAATDHAKVERINERFFRIEPRFDFMETPNVGRALRLCRKLGLRFDVMTTSFFLGRRKLIADRDRGMPLWQDRIYIALTRLAADPSDFHHLPRNRVVELGSQIAI